jgi:hypothetical protein
MTQQARNGYRKHRKATWGFALLLTLTVTAILSPLASGGGNKTYTFTVTPTSFCAGGTNSSTATITNTATTQTLGSAELFFPATSLASATVNGTAVNVASSTSGSPYLSGTYDIIGPLNNLNLSNGQSIPVQVTYSGSYTGSGQIQAVVKQANNFNDTSGGANLFSNPSTWPQLSIGPCQYVFTQQPVDAQTGAAQTVKVQLQTSTGNVVPDSNPLSLGVEQNGTAVSSPPFTGLGPVTQTANTWAFSVTGTTGGLGYQLVTAGSDGTQATSSSSSPGSSTPPYFNIFDCMPNGGTCSTGQVTNGDGSAGYQVSGTGLASGFNVNFTAPLLSGFAYTTCSGLWGWAPMSYPGSNGPAYFPSLTTSPTTYLAGTTSAYQLVTLYFLNSLYVQTSASQTNSIQICAGAEHRNGLTGPWTGASGILAQKDDTGTYWGVLQRIPNCNANKVPVDSSGIKSPALCAWGTTTLPNGLSYRSATVIVPYDWDGKFGA